MADSYKEYASKEYVQEVIDNVPQYDWNQNDPDGGGYIKNRTHYITSESLIGILPFTATGSNKMEYLYSSEDSDIFSHFCSLGTSAQLIRADIDGHSAMFSASFARGYYSFYGDLSGSMNLSSSEKVWGATIADDTISLVSGNTYEVSFYDTTQPGYHPLDVGYMPREVYTTSNAPVKFGTGANSTVQGRDTQATSDYAHAEGWYAIASGQCSHAEGESTVASGEYSHAEGCGAEASGYCSHVEGWFTVAGSKCEHVQGRYNAYDDSIYVNNIESSFVWAIGTYYAADSYSFDNMTGNYTLAEPVEIDLSSVTPDEVISKYIAKNNPDIKMYYITSFVAGDPNDDEKPGKFICQQYSSKQKNLTYGEYAHIVGNGTSEDERSNAHTLDWDGNAWYAGDVYVGGTSQSDAVKITPVEYIKAWTDADANWVFSNGHTFETIEALVLANKPPVIYVVYTNGLIRYFYFTIRYNNADGTHPLEFRCDYGTYGYMFRVNPSGSHTVTYYTWTPANRTINGKALSSNITLTAHDVGAATTTHTHTQDDVILTDTSTGTQYKLVVTDGNLSITAYSET